MGMKSGLPPKAKDKEGEGFAKKISSGKFENNRQEFSKNVRRIKQIGLNFYYSPDARTQH